MTNVIQPKRRAAGSWTNVAAIKRRSGSSWVDVWPVSAALSVNLTNHTVSGTPISNDVPPPPWIGAFSRINFLSTGDLTGEGSNMDGTIALTNYSGEWLTAGDNTDVEIRVTATGSGGTLTGTTGSWLSMSSDRVWSLDTTDANLGSRTLTVQLRNATTLAVLDTATITLNIA